MIRALLLILCGFVAISVSGQQTSTLTSFTAAPTQVVGGSNQVISVSATVSPAPSFNMSVDMVFGGSLFNRTPPGPCASIFIAAGSTSGSCTGIYGNHVFDTVDTFVTASAQNSITVPVTVFHNQLHFSAGPGEIVGGSSTVISLSVSVDADVLDDYGVNFEYGPYLFGTGGVTIPAGSNSAVLGDVQSFAVSQPVSSYIRVFNGIPADMITVPITVLPTVDRQPFSPRSDCEGICSEPINLHTGNTWIEQQDYSLPGLGGGISLRRTWNSLWQSMAPPATAGMFGLNWWSNLEERLQVIDTNTIRYWRADGAAWVMAFNSGANNYTVSSPPDERATLVFDSSTTLYTLTLKGGNKRIFNNAGRLTKFRDRNGNETVLAYDGLNRIIQVTDAGGRSITFSYINAQFPSLATSVQDSTGNIANYTYSSNRLSQVAYPDGGRLNFSYDANNFITSVRDDQGKTLESHTYDSSGRGLTAARANGVDAVTVSYTSQGTTTLTDSRNFITTYGSARILATAFTTSVEGPGCASCGGRRNQIFSYDGAGNRTSRTDPSNNVTNYTYDAAGNLTQVKSPVDGTNFQIWNYTYNSFGQVLTATDPFNNVTTNTYDTKGNLLTTTTPPPVTGGTGSKTTFTYDLKGQLTKITDPRNNATTIAYFPSGLISQITDAQTKITKFEYDLRGNRTAVVDGLNNRTTFEYDARNRLKKINYPTTPATSTSFTYDTRGRRTSVTDANSKVTTYGYDDADRLTSVTDAQTPVAGVTAYEYDTENNLSKITDAAGRETTFLYNADGQVTLTTFPSTLTESYTYDAAGNLKTKTDRKSQTITYTYDFLNRLTNKAYPDTTSVNYTYDLANRLTQVSDPTGTYQLAYDKMGRLTQATTQLGFIPGKTFTVKYGYDAASNRTSMTDPQNAATAYVYDTLNRLTKLTFPTRTDYTFTYDALGRRTQLGRPNTIKSNYTYDSLSQLTSVLHKKNTTTLDGAAYTYDAAGARTSKTDKRTNVVSNFAYDPIYQLTSVTQGASTTESYTYDLVGNRLSSLGISPYDYNSSNQLTATPGATYTYDNNGNTLTKVEGSSTTNYTWDFENRLTRVTLPGGAQVNFKYDPFGRRVQKSAASGTTNYLYDGANILEEIDTTGNAVLARYVQGLGIDEPLGMTRGGVTSYYDADGLGSITSLTNSSGAIASSYTYDAFGRLVAGTGALSNPYRYTAREFDSETGLYYYRGRYYDSSTGRFMNEDPSGLYGGLNKFSYVLNNSTNAVDPLGLATTVIFVWDNPINHAAIHIDNGGKPFDHEAVIYDPGGSYSTDHGCGSGDACTGASLSDYINYYKKHYPGSKVDLIRIATTPEEEAEIANRIDAMGGGSPGLCSTAAGDAVRDIGPFKDLGGTATPSQLRNKVLKIHDGVENLSREVLRKLVPKLPDLKPPGLKF